MKILVTQLCPTVCNPMDHSPPGSSVYGISQARILEQLAISFSRGSSRPRFWTHVSCVSCIGRQFFTTLPQCKGTSSQIYFDEHVIEPNLWLTSNEDTLRSLTGKEPHSHEIGKVKLLRHLLHAHRISGISLKYVVCLEDKILVLGHFKVKSWSSPVVLILG